MYVSVPKYVRVYNGHICTRIIEIQCMYSSFSVHQIYMYVYMRFNDVLTRNK